MFPNSCLNFYNFQEQKYNGELPISLRYIETRNTKLSDNFIEIEKYYRIVEWLFLDRSSLTRELKLIKRERKPCRSKDIPTEEGLSRRPTSFAR